MTDNPRPPANALRVQSWADTPALTKPATYEAHTDGAEPKSFTVSKLNRRVLEALMRGPLYAASPCRISDKVLSLRRDQGLEIECVLFKGDAETHRQLCGVYFLRTRVIRAEEVAA